MKNPTLPISATVAYDTKNDTVVMTSSDDILEGSRFRLTLRRNTTEDLLLRKLLTGGASRGDDDSTPAVKTVPEEILPAPTEGLNGRIPLGTTWDDETLLWNTSRQPHCIVVAENPHERAAFTEMLRAVVVAQDDWEFYPLSTVEEKGMTGFDDLEYRYLAPRYQQMREEGVTWYSDSSAAYKKVFVFIEAADTLRPDWERLLNRVLTLGPAAGITVVAISAEVPDWQSRVLKNFTLKLSVGSFGEPGAYGEHAGFLKDWHSIGFTIAGEHAAALRAGNSCLPIRFFGMPEKQ